jgi:hypothetical protein
VKTFRRNLKYHRAVLNRIFRTSETTRELLSRLSVYGSGCVDLCLAMMLHALAQLLDLAARVIGGKEAA